MGTSVMLGMMVSEAHTWWQNIARYLAGGMILCFFLVTVQGLDQEGLRGNQFPHAQEGVFENEPD